MWRVQIQSSGEICRLFEQWACSRHQSKLPTIIPCIILNYSLGADERDSLENVRKQCTRMGDKRYTTIKSETRGGGGGGGGGLKGLILKFSPTLYATFCNF